MIFRRFLLPPLVSAMFAGTALPAQGTTPQLPAAQAGVAQPPAVAPASFLRPEDHRVIGIVYRLGLAGRPFCPVPFPLTGLAFHHLGDYRPEDRPTVIDQYGLDRGPGILSVIEGSPAAQAGLVAGDALLTANGARFRNPAEIASERGARLRRASAASSEMQLEEQLRRGPVELEVVRGGAVRRLTLGSIPACPALGRLARSGQDNAFADGRYTIMTTDFLDEFRNDDELAVALAHELAHNILRHPQQLAAQGVPRNFLRHIGGNARRVRATEIAADRLSVHLLAAAGFDLDAIIPLWRRLESRLDSRLTIISAHPRLRARERNFNEVIAEVRGAAPARR